MSGHIPVATVGRVTTLDGFALIASKESECKVLCSPTASAVLGWGFVALGLFAIFLIWAGQGGEVSAAGVILLLIWIAVFIAVEIW
jgi:hypothetical protein